MSRLSSTLEIKVIYSTSTQYALRALIHLAITDRSGPVLVREIAAAENVPKQFLSKILNTLRNRGLVESTKGPGGGFVLARPRNSIQVSEVIEALDGPTQFDLSCILGLEECSDTVPCALHDAWKKFREEYVKSLTSLTLDDLVRTLDRKQTQRVHPESANRGRRT